jgi:hypothetical protein
MMLQVVGRFALLCSLLAGLACGGGTETIPAPFTDGERLVARQFSFAGTTPLFIGIYDTVEGVACEFVPAGDGNMRCIPPDDTAAADTPDRWVLGVQGPSPETGGRLLRNDVRGEDGSLFPAVWAGELFDTSTGEPCSADLRKHQADGMCLPRHAEITGLFADSTCSEPVATVPAASPPPLLTVDADGALFGVGEEWTGPTFVSIGATMCLALPMTATRVVRVGDPLPADTVAPIRVAPRGDARLAVQTVEAEGVGITTMRYRHYHAYPTVTTAPYLDRSRRVLCSPMATVDGETLCLPADALVETRPDLLSFADATCMRPVIAQERRYAIFASEAAVGGPLAYEVHHVATAPSETGFVKTAAGGCGESIKNAGYPVGDITPLASFARLGTKP